MSNKSGTSDQVISLPKGGGAMHGMGEKFSPDLHTGTGNFTVPIALPPGRNGFHPQLNLTYSTGNGNGFWGLGWGLSIPGVSRKTAQGVPRYRDYDPNQREKPDVFILSGAEDLVPVATPVAGVTRYRPRTEGLFARIDHHHTDGDDYWEVRSKDGLVSIYGTPATRGTGDPAAIGRNPRDKFAWKLTETRDPFGNRIVYTYGADQGDDGPHTWSQPKLERIEYAEFDDSGQDRFLISVSFEYEERPDPFSDYRAGFEVRTTQRCTKIIVATHVDQERIQRIYHLVYLDQRGVADHLLPRNGISLLSQIWVEGRDESTPNLLTNSDFAFAGPLGRATSFPGQGYAQSSAANGWTLWLNVAGTIDTSLEQCPFPLAGPSMIKVHTTSHWGGLVHNFDREHHGPQRVTAGAWVYVVSGQVGLGIGDGGNTNPDILSATTGRWEWIEGPNGVSPANELIIYATSQGGADFYVAQASVAERSRSEWLPPLEFDYSRFEPAKRRFEAVAGAQLPAQSLGNPSLELADLTGDGLPDILEMNGTVRTWRNLGGGCFDMPRVMRSAAPPVQLADPGVQMLDADGDGRIDLMVTDGALTQVYPLNFDGEWDKPVSKPSAAVPSFNLEDPEVKLVDLDGDGVTDAIRSGASMEVFIYDRTKGWQKPRPVARKALDEFPNVNFSDPRVKWADMTGDGLQDIVLVHDGAIDYWPNLGHGNWGKRVRMHGSPRPREYGYTSGYDPKRLLLGDVDGDGLADIVYVGNHTVTLWINRSGNGWSAPTEIRGTPGVTDMDSVRLVDLLGSGISGLLWSADASGNGRPHMFFLDFTGGVKPYLLHEMDNHLGATTRVEYRPSTRFYLEDRARRQPWRTSLPFPVQVVAHVEVSDHLSQGKLTTEYRYHHGYWDGAEREFRGFGMVEQLDSETFDGQARPQFFSPPTMTRTWFHQGPIGPEIGEWQADLDLSDTFWSGDRRLLDPWEHINQFLMTDLAGSAPNQRRIRRDALRTLRGSILRTELYALDRTASQDRIDPALDRPYTVTESQYALAEVDPPVGQAERQHIFFPHAIAQRTTQWERGDDPMTQFTFTDHRDENGDLDTYGRPLRQTQIACPRGWRTLADTPAIGYLASRTRTDYAERDDGNRYMVDRVKRTTTLEFKQVDTHGKKLGELRSLPDGDNIFQCIGQTVSYYDGLEADLVNDYGRLGDYGVATRTETLAFTEIILDDAYGAQRPPYLTPGAITWPAAYPPDFQQRIDGLPDHAGYVFRDGVAATHYEAGYFVVTRQQYDFQANPAKARGLVVAQIDPLGNVTTIGYDHELLPSSVQDPVGLETTAQYNYRLLQPRLVTDPNGNRTAVEYSPIGLPLSIAVIGKHSAEQGDRLREPALPAQSAVDYPSTRFEYHFRAFDDSPPEDREPVSVRTLKRQEHFWDIVHAENQRRHASGQPDLTDAEMDALFPADELARFNERFIETREYSDGFGRLLQARTQGEEERFGDPALGDGVVPADQGDTAGTIALVQGKENRSTSTPNVVVSGWQTYDNKGRVVEKYEPYFDVGWDYDPRISPQGVKATMFYDPRGQVVRTLNPDGSEQRVIYGIPQALDTPDVFDPTPWEAYTYDANDLAPLSRAPDGTALTTRAPQGHHYTPSSIEIDALGRTVKAVQRLTQSEEIVTRSEYDLRGNVLKVIDPLGRDAFVHVFDLANRRLHLASIDAGERRTVFDAGGNMVEGSDSKGAWVLHAYDRLNRPTHLWAKNDAGDALVTLREQITYGDGGNPSQPAAERQANRQVNRLAKPASHDDEAGTLQFQVYDFKGNLLKKVRRVVADSALVPGQLFKMDWATPPALDPAEYATEAEFDALNRLRSTSETLSVGGVITTRKTLRPHYNRAGGLQRVTLDGAVYVERIAYNPKGQRTLVAYGNGLLTRYAYDPQTFRLARLRTESCTTTAVNYQPGGTVRQDFSYEYDLAGNITAIHDRTPDWRLTPQPFDRQFTYDAIYRLHSADGRECDTLPPAPPWDDAFRCNDLTKTRPYQQSYTYDVAGNMLQLQHAAGPNGSFTRDFAVRPNNNQLDHLAVGNTTYAYVYDFNGNMTQENTERHFQWDHSDRLVRFRVQATPASPASVDAHYLYDAGGQRIKKCVRNQQGQVDAIVYIDGLFEHHRWQRSGGQAGENTHVHVMDNQSRVAIVREGPRHPCDGGEKVQYHLGDHLGSSNVAIGGDDEKASGFINHEEFYPYGETSFGSFARKRYRFTGKERDEESGLSYHGARYYAPWTARWTSSDPAGLVDGPNLYCYSRNCPLLLSDPNGMDPPDPKYVLEKIFEGNPKKLNAEAAKSFRTAVENAKANTGVDISKDPGDTVRDLSSSTNKAGASNYSWHKTGRAIDLNQSQKWLIQEENKGSETYFRRPRTFPTRISRVGRRVRSFTITHMATK